MSENIEHFLCCGRVFQDAVALEKHVRDSPRHQLQTISDTSEKGAGETGSSTDPSVPRTASTGCFCEGTGDGGKNTSKESGAGKQGENFASNVSLGLLDGLDGANVWRVKGAKSVLGNHTTLFVERRQGEEGEVERKAGASHPSYGIYSGSGEWCSDVGDEHLCDGECGWCGRYANVCGRVL